MNAKGSARAARLRRLLASRSICATAPTDKPTAAELARISQMSAAARLSFETRKGAAK